MHHGENAESCFYLRWIGCENIELQKSIQDLSVTGAKEDVFIAVRGTHRIVLSQEFRDVIADIAVAIDENLWS